MRKELISFETKPTAKTITIWMALFSLIFSIIGIFLLIGYGLSGNKALLPMGIMYTILPIFYLTIGYLFIRFTLWLYNKVAKKFGGIIINTQDKE
jgi:ABC-type multidrug transport system permease subunit